VSLFREVGDSGDTAYHSDMYVTSQMANRFKEIHWWQIDRRCWVATYGPNTQAHRSQHTSVRPRTAMESRGLNGQEKRHTTPMTMQHEKGRERSWSEISPYPISQRSWGLRWAIS
jgi:hypothetical protein